MVEKIISRQKAIYFDYEWKCLFSDILIFFYLFDIKLLSPGFLRISILAIHCLNKRSNKIGRVCWEIFYRCKQWEVSADWMRSDKSEILQEINKLLQIPTVRQPSIFQLGKLFCSELQTLSTKMEVEVLPKLFH